MMGNGSGNSQQTFDELKSRGDRAIAEFRETWVLLQESLAARRDFEQENFEAHRSFDYVRPTPSAIREIP